MGGYKKDNVILADYGDWLEVDVSTPKHPGAIMKIDRIDWDRIQDMGVGRICAYQPGRINYPYAQCKLDRKQKYIHRLVMNEPGSGQVDHINHVGLDNRSENLRTVTSRINLQNRIGRGTSKYIGVCWHKSSKKWIVQIRYNGQSNYLGLFSDEDEAGQVYIDAVHKLGEKMVGE